MNPQIEMDLARLLEIKKELLTNLLCSLRRSAEFLETGDMDSFNSEMDSTSGIPAAVDELSTAEAGLKSGLPPAMRNGEIAGLEKNIALILGQLELAQKACKDAAQAKLLHYGRQIKSVRSTQKGIKGYAGQRYKREALFIDEKK